MSELQKKEHLNAANRQQLKDGNLIVGHQRNSGDMEELLIYLSKHPSLKTALYKRTRDCETTTDLKHVLKDKMQYCS